TWRAAWRGQPGRRQRQAAPLRRRAPAPCAGLDEVEKLLPRGVLHGVVALGAELVEVTEVNAFRKAHARHADPVWR
ncbi:hypothetical protein, partial [Streptomyces sp. NPDC005093]